MTQPFQPYEPDAETVRDAMRYRWLRNCSNYAPDDTPTVYGARVGCGYDHAWIIEGEQLDAAIDAAIAKAEATP